MKFISYNDETYMTESIKLFPISSSRSRGSRRLALYDAAQRRTIRIHSYRPLALFLSRVLLWTRRLGYSV
jgi:hypothetical protein